MIDTIQKIVKNQRYEKKFYNVNRYSSFFVAVRYFNFLKLSLNS